MSKADNAVAHVLGRILNDPRLAYYFDPMTESMALLIAAYAEAHGSDDAEVREQVERRFRAEAPVCRECRESVMPFAEQER